MRVLLLFAAVLPACTAREDIRVKDRSGFLVSGRVAFQREFVHRERTALDLGVEAGGWYTGGDYASPTGFKDHALTVGYAAGLADLRVDDVHVLGRLGVGYGGFEVEGQSRTLRDDGFGVVGGVEARWNALPQLDLFARNTFFARSSLDASLRQLGAEWRATDALGLELGYGWADNRIEEDTLFPTEDNAVVRVRGVSVGAVLRF